MLSLKKWSIKWWLAVANFCVRLDSSSEGERFSDSWSGVFQVWTDWLCLCCRSSLLRRRCWGKRGNWMRPGRSWPWSDSSSTSSCPLNCRRTARSSERVSHAAVIAQDPPPASCRGASCFSKPTSADWLRPHRISLCIKVRNQTKPMILSFDNTEYVP